MLCHFAPISETKQTACFRLYDTCFILPVIAVEVYCKVPTAATVFANVAAISAAITAAVAIALGATVATAIPNIVSLCRSPHHHLCAIYSAVILVGKSTRNSTEFCNYSDSGPFELRNFHQIFFPIKKSVPANSKHVPAGLESSPAIDSSNIMNPKTFPLYLSVASGIKF